MKKRVPLKSGKSRIPGSLAPADDPPIDDDVLITSSTGTAVAEDTTQPSIASLNDSPNVRTRLDANDRFNLNLDIPPLPPIPMESSPHPLLRATSPKVPEGSRSDDDPKNPEEDDLLPPLVRRDTDKSDASTTSYDEEVGKKGGLRRRRDTFSDDEIQNIPRLVHRNLPFKQSRQQIAVENKTDYRSFRVQRILSQDWYHVFLRQSTWFSLCCLLLFWTLFIVVFALIYQKIDRDNPSVACGLGTKDKPIEFTPAFAFSLETCTTVGYGLPNSTNGFFETECLGLQISIYFQMMWSMLFNAFLFSFVFARLARCESRGAQVLFSDKAIMEVRDGKWMLHVRIYDVDSSQPVVEAHVRMYCVSWRDYERQARDLVQPHLLHTMRLLQPNDELGAPLFTSIPANVTHSIDAFSPLAPMRMRNSVKYLPHSGLPLREADQFCGNRDGVLCPVCGETFGTMDSLKRHVQYQQLCEQNEGFPLIGSHRDRTLVKPNLFKPFLLTESDIREQLRDKEIMVIVEGIERKCLSQIMSSNSQYFYIVSDSHTNPIAMVSGTFQALQSYKLNDIIFGGRFQPCMSQANGKIYVDVDKFHTILPPNDGSIHRYSQFNGGHTHRLNTSVSYLPEFFRKGKFSRAGFSDDFFDGATPNSTNQRKRFNRYSKRKMFDGNG